MCKVLFKARACGIEWVLSPSLELSHAGSRSEVCTRPCAWARVPTMYCIVIILRSLYTYFCPTACASVCVSTLVVVWCSTCMSVCVVLGDIYRAAGFWFYPLKICSLHEKVSSGCHCAVAGHPKPASQ